MLSSFSGCLFRLMRSSSMRQQWYVLSAGMKRIADLLFVDNLVGTKYSFVEDTKLLVKTDLTILLKEIFNKEWEPPTESSVHRSRVLQRKIVVTLGLAALEATEAGNLKLKLGGVALGDSWISPKDFVFSRDPLLKDVPWSCLLYDPYWWWGVHLVIRYWWQIHCSLENWWCWWGQQLWREGQRCLVWDHYLRRNSTLKKLWLSDWKLAKIPWITVYEITVRLINYTKRGKKLWNLFHLQPRRDQKGELQILHWCPIRLEMTVRNPSEIAYQSKPSNKVLSWSKLLQKMSMKLFGNILMLTQ